MPRGGARGATGGPWACRVGMASEGVPPAAGRGGGATARRGGWPCAPWGRPRSMAVPGPGPAPRVSACAVRAAAPWRAAH